MRAPDRQTFMRVACRFFLGAGALLFGGFQGIKENQLLPSSVFWAGAKNKETRELLSCDRFFDRVMLETITFGGQGISRPKTENQKGKGKFALGKRTV